MSLDPQAIRAFEHAGWQQAAPGYGATFARATCGFVDDLLDAARVGAGMQVLDLACEPVSSRAQHGCVAPCPRDFDFAAAMIGLARAAHPAICFEEGDAEALPFADTSFDAVISNFGIRHVPGSRPGTVRGAASLTAGWTDRVHELGGAGRKYRLEAALRCDIGA
jgi:hypothetical protein